MTGGIGEEAEELRIRPQQEAGIAALQAGLIRGHRAIEREEIRILAIGFGDDDGGLAIGLGADLLRLLAALGAELGGFALPFGLHALVDRLAVLLRQIGTPDP